MKKKFFLLKMFLFVALVSDVSFLDAYSCALIATAPIISGTLVAAASLCCMFGVEFRKKFQEFDVHRAKQHNRDDEAKNLIAQIDNEKRPYMLKLRGSFVLAALGLAILGGGIFSKYHFGC